jgi:hypothetical protein
VILKGPEPDERLLSVAAGLVQHFSKFRAQDPLEVNCAPAGGGPGVRRIRAAGLAEKDIRSMTV